MTRNEKLEAKRKNALEAHNALVCFLDSHGFPSWAERFREVTAALNAGDLTKAISLEKAIPRAGMGSFGDFYVDPIEGEEDWEAWSRFVFFTGAQHKSIGHIRVFLDYDMDRPLVDLDFDGQSAEAKKEALKKLR